MAESRQFPSDAPQLKTLYGVVLAVLGLTLLAGVGAWVATIFVEKAMPDGLSNLVSLIAGGLIGLLAPQPGKTG
jgi:hypothetical protein